VLHIVLQKAYEACTNIGGRQRAAWKLRLSNIRDIGKSVPNFLGGQWTLLLGKGCSSPSGKGMFSDEVICYITTVRLNVEKNQLVNVFGEFSFCIGCLKSA
jgi:hypothetical protein